MYTILFREGKSLRSCENSPIKYLSDLDTEVTCRGYGCSVGETSLDILSGLVWQSFTGTVQYTSRKNSITMRSWPAI